ncbi:MAG: carboxypeptidase regulatory-like domain-containing protein [Gemmatimonas sp.]
MPTLRSIRLRLVAAVALLVPASLHSQSSDASIVGSVRDSAGTALSGVTVTVVNTGTGRTWTLFSNTAGRFAFVQLPLGGPYTVSARRIGLEPEARAGYTLALSRRTVVDFSLKWARTELAAVNITGSARDSRTATLGGNRRVDAQQIAAVPAVNRNFTGLAALAPTTGVQLSMLGQRWTSTDVRIDGAQAKNMLRAGEFGAGPFTLSLEAIREFDVSTTVYDVTQGRQGGGNIRAASKSGTNEWHGSAFSYYRNSNLAAASDFQLKSRSQRQFNALQWGTSIGGPIVRDKAHIFVAFDAQNSDEPLFTGLLQTPADEVSANVARDSLSRLIRILGTRYGLDTSRAQIGRLDRQPIANTLFAKLDWTLSPRHQLTVTENLNAWDSPLSGGVDQSITLFEARSNYRSLEQQTLATLRSTKSSGLQNSLSLGVSTSKRTLTANSSLPRGFVRIQSRLANGNNGDTRVQFGGNRLAPDDSREVQIQLMDQMYFQRGDVLFTLGTDNSFSRLTTYIAESQSGLFEFNNLAELDALRASRYSRTLPLADARPTTRQNVLELGAFAQAEWRPTPRLTTTLGLRWDGTAFLSKPPRNALVEQVLGEQTDRAPKDWSKIQPRAQIVWGVDGTGRDLIRVGGGRFAAQPIYYLQHNQLLNDGSRIADITATGAAIPVPNFSAYRTDPSTIPGLAPGASAPAPYVNLVDANYTTPSVWKGSISYRRRVFDALSLTGTYIASRTGNNYMYTDRNLRADPAFMLSNENNRPVFVASNTIDGVGRTLNANALANRQLGRVLKLDNSARATNQAAIAEAAVTLPRAARIDASFTYNRAYDNSTFGCCLARTATTYTPVQGDPRDLSGSWGPSDTEFRNKVVVSGALPVVWGIQIGARYVGSKGRPISAIVNGDINGDEATSNDLAFVFNPDDPATPTAVADAMRRVLNNPRNVARTYLRENLGQIATRNGAFAPWTERIDFRATKDIRTFRGQWLNIGLDIFNVANLLNSRWGAEYQLPVGISNQNPVVQRLPLLNVVGFNQLTRTYNYTVNESFGVLQKGGNPYQIQLSLRYGF